MSAHTFTLTLFTAGAEVASVGLNQASKTLFRRSGFEIVFDKAQDIHQAFGSLIPSSDSYSDWFVALDLIPWVRTKSHLEGIEWNDVSENHRVEWSVHAVRRFLNEHLRLSSDGEGRGMVLSDHAFSWHSSTESILKQFSGAYPDTYAHLVEEVESFKCEFKVVRELTSFGCNNRIDLVEHQGVQYICKTFKPDRIKYLENEVTARDQFGALICVPKIIERDKNYLLMEYIRNAQPVYSLLNRYGLLGIRAAKRIFSGLKAIYDKGYLHLDFHAENLLVTSSGGIFFIDFEYLGKHNFESSIADSPVFASHDKLLYNSPLDEITYNRAWYGLVRISVWLLLHAPSVVLGVIRLGSNVRLSILENRRRVTRRLTKLSRVGF